MNRIRISTTLLLCGVSFGCVAPSSTELVNPSKVYADQIRKQNTRDAFRSPNRVESNKIDPKVMPLGRLVTLDESAKARVRFVSDEMPPELSGPGNGVNSDGIPHHVIRQPEPDTEVVTNQNTATGTDPGFYKYESTQRDTRDYSGPLEYGDPGVTSSLWKESRAGNDLFRDFRAWQPMDLITITVDESAEGKKTANTEVKEKSSVAIAIEKLFGIETAVKNANNGANSGIDPTSLVSASTQNDFKGEGKTNRKDTLTAKISAMVAEVLPSGILRVEGQKIIAVNSEEQIMVISGLVRPRDINSANEVSSAKIANMRIDYFGKGIVDESQHGGWGSRLLRVIWPF